MYLPTSAEKVIAFQQYVIGLHKGHDYLLSQMGSADETPVSFDEPSNNVIEEIGTKSVIIKTLGNEKMCITVMLAVLADGIKLPPYVILKRKTMLKDQLPTGIIVRCQNQGWMSTDLMKDWLNIVWNSRPGVLVHKRRMLVLRTLRGYLTPAMKNIIGAKNTALAVVPVGMSQLWVPDVAESKPVKECLSPSWLWHVIPL
ncbi:hypothetical protein DUI87_07353 [Hirundo rustica rustica]|uniref:DDE-1 domain-containing protein n=1 Tax=Hirundo rustica rustica TaxID=333673 RepID=A0A3M0KRB5_HIRRU|nr:hypothetical protein DUI87_07353 [Hirundo rustica rustica]